MENDFVLISEWIAALLWYNHVEGRPTILFFLHLIDYLRSKEVSYQTLTAMVGPTEIGRVHSPANKLWLSVDELGKLEGSLICKCIHILRRWRDNSA